MCGLDQKMSCRFARLLASHQNELRPHWQRLTASPALRSWLSGSSPRGKPPPRAPLSWSSSSAVMRVCLPWSPDFADGAYQHRSNLDCRTGVDCLIIKLVIQGKESKRAGQRSGVKIMSQNPVKPDSIDR